jgi:hypothetical protein
MKRSMNTFKVYILIMLGGAPMAMRMYYVLPAFFQQFLQSDINQTTILVEVGSF